jgi:hypothetical protein
VIAGENAGSKRAKAEELSIPILPPEVFPALLEGGVDAALRMVGRDRNNA